MLRSTIEEGFEVVTSQEKADIVINGGDCLFYTAFPKDKSLPGIYFIISKKDAAKAVASTPSGYDAHIDEPDEFGTPFASTFGFFLDRVPGLEGAEKIAFIDEVRKWQSAESDIEKISVVERESAFDSLQEILLAPLKEDRARATLSIKDSFHEYNESIGISVQVYAKTNTLCVTILCYEEDELYPEEYCTATTCIPGADLPDKCCAYVNINVHGFDIEKFLTENGLAERVGSHTARSGFLDYPLYRFNMERLKEFDPKNVESYLKIK